MFIGYSYTSFGDVSFAHGLVCLIIVGVTLGSVLTLFSLPYTYTLIPTPYFLLFILSHCIQQTFIKLPKCAGTVLSGEAK